jgi:DinB superfamily
MPTNPYASFLGAREPREVIEATAGRLRALLEDLGAEGAARAPAPGKWSAQQILCHLADCEIVFAFRLRQALAQDDYVIQPFDQDRWAAAYNAFDVSSAMAVFNAVRTWNLGLIAAMTPAHLSKKLSHPERGEMTVQVVVETMAGHDLNHLAQIERIVAVSHTAGGV